MGISLMRFIIVFKVFFVIRSLNVICNCFYIWIVGKAVHQRFLIDNSRAFFGNRVKTRHASGANLL